MKYKTKRENMKELKTHNKHTTNFFFLLYELPLSGTEQSMIA
jgi:hypothetical protein